MSKLQQLRMRLEKLPQLEKEQKLAASFSHYTQRAKQSREKFEQAFKDMGHITQIFPNSKCKRIVFPLLQSIAKEAKKVHEMIENNPWKIEAGVTENKFVRLSGNANLARTRCNEIWNEEIRDRITNWEKIADVVQKLGIKGGQAIKQAVDMLKIREMEIPQNENEIDQVKLALKALKKGVVSLGLEGSFGKFLKEAAEGNASPKDLFEDEIKEKMDEHKLWDAFRVRLG